MKGLEEFTDIIAMSIGMAGALMKGLKKRLKIQTILITMIIAGILSFSLLGVLELFYHDLTPRLIILVSFIVGWLANEITEKIDLFFDDIYEYFIKWIKTKK
jgi:CHASE2 domain-containing sensor protein